MVHVLCWASVTSFAHYGDQSADGHHLSPPPTTPSVSQPHSFSSWASGLDVNFHASKHEGADIISFKIANKKSTKCANCSRRHLIQEKKHSSSTIHTFFTPTRQSEKVDRMQWGATSVTAEILRCSNCQKPAHDHQSYHAFSSCANASPKTQHPGLPARTKIFAPWQHARQFTRPRKKPSTPDSTCSRTRPRRRMMSSIFGSVLTFRSQRTKAASKDHTKFRLKYVAEDFTRQLERNKDTPILSPNQKKRRCTRSTATINFSRS
ncbi:hypothetical protein IWX50DRAFT_620655 [Phyllosticta citricarpa]